MTRKNMSFTDQLFSFSLRNKSRVIFIFKLLYCALFAFLILGSYAAYTLNSLYGFFYQTALWSGRSAIVLYMITTIPGITRRFGIHHKTIGILMLFRRYIGITMFILVLNHFMVVKGALMFKGIFDVSPPVFQIFGSLAFLCLIPMVMTSNDISVSKLGAWWGKIHTLTYIIVWFIFLHVALQRISIWSILIGITAIAQISSHLFSVLKSRKTIESPK